MIYFLVGVILILGFIIILKIKKNDNSLLNEILAYLVSNQQDYSAYLCSLITKQDSIDKVGCFLYNTKEEKLTLVSSSQKFKEVFLHNELILSNNILQLQALEEEDLQLNNLTCNALCFPIIQQELIGAIVILHDGLTERNHLFLRKNLPYLSLLLQMQYFTKSLDNSENFQQELLIARNIQESILPTDLDKLASYNIASFQRAAKEVSGDFYDSIKIDESRTLIVIADASGKGVGACLTGVMVRSILRSACVNFISLELLLQEVNNNAYKDTSEGKFVTMTLVLLDDNSDVIEIVKAGHTEVLLKNSINNVQRLNPVGTAIGLLPQEYITMYESFSFSCKSGNSILLYSDGITEAYNKNKEQYSTTRLIDFFQKYDVKNNINSFGESLFQELDTYCNNSKQDDDQTFIIICRK